MGNPNKKMPIVICISGNLTRHCSAIPDKVSVHVGMRFRNELFPNLVPCVTKRQSCSKTLQATSLEFINAETEVGAQHPECLSCAASEVEVPCEQRKRKMSYAELRRCSDIKRELACRTTSIHQVLTAPSPQSIRR